MGHPEKLVLFCKENELPDVLCMFWICHSDRHFTVNGCVGSVNAAHQLVVMEVAVELGGEAIEMRVYN